MNGDEKRRQTLIAVIFAIVLPTFVTWIYFILFEGTSAIIGGAGKAIQFAFPVCWVILWMKMSLRDAGLPKPQNDDRPWSARTSLLVGIGTGIAIGITMVGYYKFAIAGNELAGLVVAAPDRQNPPE